MLRTVMDGDMNQQSLAGYTSHPVHPVVNSVHLKSRFHQTPARPQDAMTDWVPAAAPIEPFVL